MTFIQTLSDEAILNFLANDTPMENYAVNDIWNAHSGVRGYLTGDNKTPYAENSVRMGVARVQSQFQRQMRDATKSMKNGTRHPAFWGETMKHLMKDSHRIGYLSAVGGHAHYDRGHQDNFSKAVSTRFLWMNKFVSQINERGIQPADIAFSGSLSKGTMATYVSVKFPDNPFLLKQNTVDSFQRSMWKATKELYGNRASFQFGSFMLDLIEQQYGRAWREGMKSLELDPKNDMTSDASAILQDAIVAEFEHVQRFAQDVITAAYNKAGYEQFRQRIDMWANRYNQIREMAIRTFAATQQRLQWVEGDTLMKCDICKRLDGIVAFAQEWDMLNVHPQHAPNPYLAPSDGKTGCSGWHCDCKLVPTDQRRTAKAFDQIMNIVTAV